MGYSERPSDAPLAIENTGSASVPAGPDALRALIAKLPPRWVGLGGYLVAGILLGLVLILALSLGRPSSSNDNTAAAAVTTAVPGTVTDNVTRLYARDIGESCWRGLESKEGAARLTVSLEVGTDGHVRYAVASGETPEMRSCVEQHVKRWQFLPQSQPTTMALPFEVERRYQP